MLSEMRKWFSLVALYPENRLSLRGREIRDTAARYRFFETQPLSEELFDEFTWGVSINAPANDLIGNNLSWLIISDRAKKALSHLPNLGAEFLKLPPRVFSESRYKSNGWLCHPLHKRCAFDSERSEFSVDVGEREYISAIQRLSVKAQVLRDASSMVRLAEYEPIILVDLEFKCAWENAGCTGVYFSPVEQDRM